MNVFICEVKKEKKLLVEFIILGYEFVEWLIVDILIIGKYMVFDLGGYWYG